MVLSTVSLFVDILQSKIVGVYMVVWRHNNLAMPTIPSIPTGEGGGGGE